jgi:hypothetical protein
MGIDRIGRASTGGAPIVPGAEPTAAVSPSFEACAAQAVQPSSEASLLQRLHAGEIDVQRYLDLRVEQATAHLTASLDAERLQFIREALRSQLESDPVLMDLVQRATGSARNEREGG